jgi:hypothetical protein
MRALYTLGAMCDIPCNAAGLGMLYRLHLFGTGPCSTLAADLLCALAFICTSFSAVLAGLRSVSRHPQ